MTDRPEFLETMFAVSAMYTSGTTERPKGTVLTHQNLQCQSLTLIRVLLPSGGFQQCGGP